MSRTSDSRGEATPRAVALKAQALARSGFPSELAERLASRPDVDFLEAVGLVRAGFPPEVAADLLVSGLRPVF